MKSKIQRIMKAVAMFVLAICLATAQQSAHAEVLFTMESSYSNGLPARSFRTSNNGMTLQINVYAESTETNDTGRLRWTLKGVGS